MAKVIKLDYPNREDYIYAIYCPACRCTHGFTERWTFNGDFEKPTFNPSMLVKSGHYMQEHKGDCWCDYNRKHPDKQTPHKCIICHSYVTNGKIKYLSDCTHEFAGKTIDLEDME